MPLSLPMSSTDTVNLSVTGMTCAACVGRVEKVLGRVPGVDSVSVNLATERAHITGNHPELPALIRAVEKAGYGAAEILPEAPPTDHASQDRQDQFHLAAAALLTAPLLGGMAFPLITGILLDRFANGYAIIFGFCSVSYIIAFIANHLLAPSFNPLRLALPSPARPDAH